MGGKRTLRAINWQIRYPFWPDGDPAVPRCLQSSGVGLPLTVGSGARAQPVALSSLCSTSVSCGH